MPSTPVIVVTGGNRGIGLEICRQLAARGAQVVLTAREESAGKAAAESVSGKSGSVRFHPLDVTEESSATKLYGYLEREFGSLDVLINNAGIVAEGDNSVLTLTTAVLQKTFATNTFAPLHLVQVLLPLLRRSRGSPRVINVSSGAGELSDFDGSWAPAYSLSKAALNLITRMLSPALERDKIAVNSMCPGWVRTDMGGANAPRNVTEGADTAVWLALDAAADFTGNFVRDRKQIPW
jgi:NAD(P)-dependent dehydrogenase (short-subunit alcohol dehydrogenase family)